MHEAEELWEELLAQIEAGQVIPIVGPELLTVVVEGKDRPLYQVLAERLLAKYGLVARVVASDGDSAQDATTVSLRPYHELTTQSARWPKAVGMCGISTDRSTTCSRRCSKPPENVLPIRCEIWPASPASSSCHDHSG